jgi:tetraacyldisaccharide 4'-kinase
MSSWLRYLLFPFALIYGAIIYVRNLLFDRKVFRSVSFDHPIISVGNLSYGGTGKTPMIEYLIRLISPLYRVASLSRGYGRKTNGYLVVESNSSPYDVGDEALQVKLKHPQAAVVVGEDRVLAIPQILADFPTDVILLDDAMQHRAVTPGMSIMLTAYDDLFTRDLILPMGTLREPKSAYKRADFIVVTKCPPDLSEEKRKAIRQEINPGTHQEVFFSYQRYGAPYSILNSERLQLNPQLDVYLVSGIAKPEYLEEQLKTQVANVYTRTFTDHHQYTRFDIEDLAIAFGNIASANKIIIVTEKDAVKLIPFRNIIVQKRLPVYIQPLVAEFFDKDKHIFDSEVLGYVGERR